LPDIVERLNASFTGRYRVEKEIGHGGMATVFHAIDLRHGREVAVKVVREDLAGSLGGDRFLREIEIAARLQHPHILPVYESGDADGLLYFVMPFVRGESLRARLAREGQLTMVDTVRIARDVAQALDFAHVKGVIHRDIKPENILLSEGIALVADFGIARAMEMVGHGPITTDGMVMGTPAYMSPEHIEGGDALDARADIFSFGAVVYEMLSGQPPFTGPTLQAIMARVQVDSPPSIRTVRPGVSPAVELAVMRALSKSRADRFATSGEFVEELERAITQPMQAARPRWNRKWMAAGVAAAGVVAIAVALRAWKSPARDDSADTLPMVAVLPFRILGDTADQYFAEGIADEITTRIGSLSGLGIISRASARQFDPTHQSIKDIATALNADFVLTGTVRIERHADGTGLVRVLPSLTRVKGNRELALQAYDAELRPGDLIRAQGQIAEAVASQMNVSVLPNERVSMERRPTQNLEAYDAFLRGKLYGTELLSRDRAATAIDQFERAVALDTSFTEAWAKLSEAHATYFYYFDRRPERLAKAKSALDRATALDSTLAETRIARGALAFWGQLDYDTALREFTAARAARPNSSELLWILGNVVKRQGKWEEAIRLTNRAIALDPQSQLYTLDVGGMYNFLHRYEDAERAYDRTLALAPDWLSPYMAKAMLYVTWRGDVTRARAVMREALAHVDSLPALAQLAELVYRPLLQLQDESWWRAAEHLTFAGSHVDSGSYYSTRAEILRWRGHPEQARAYYDSALAIWEGRRAVRNDPILHCELAIALAGLGRRDDALREGETAVRLVPIEKDAHRGPYWPSFLAQVQLMTGDRDGAFATLEGAMSHPSLLSFALVETHPMYADLRGHPRFGELRRFR
jgi:serine/threonine-protein kinase